ncbi:uncharacterized protein LOC129322054 [Prosopis cineraria]|uniref:uncharacterized protein LOC129322054 n=1 Tax=Prosopis cineraria TaxID=364024 RepID=UPI002410166D|nr:uncharacterized protein LOC129322054 [Prosopis cineraria]
MSDHLAKIAQQLETLDLLKEKVEALEASAINKNKKPGEARRRHYYEDEESEDEQENRRRTRFHRTKIEFPKFSGGDPRGWILKAEKYFKYYNTPEEEKVDVASLALEGDALELFAWISHERTLNYWDELVTAFQENLGPLEYQNPDEFLCSIRQEGSVQEYRTEFAKRSSRVKNWPEHCLLGVFLNGLKEELRSDVRIHKPRSVYRAVSLALEIESKTQLTKTRPSLIQTQTRYPNPSTPGARDPKYTEVTFSTSSQRASTPSGPKSASVVSTKNSSMDFEHQRRRDKGLCFRCGDLFRPGHRCRGSFSLMEITEEGDEVALPLEDGEPEEIRTEGAEISLNAILGSNTGSAMKLKELRLPTHYISAFGVQIGDSSIVRCNRVCKDVRVKLTELTIKEDFFPFSLGGADLVLGIKWLASLNTVQANWNELFMIFWLNGKRYKLQGVPNATSGAQFNSMQQIEASANSTPLQCFNPESLFAEFPSVFEGPSNLPPFRNHSHAIPLLPGANPPNLRPYRYPYYQKAEIEKQVEELLKKGFIQPSSSPFASPVLLVAKKDGSWRFCVDYRKLNAITIPDKYPIPNIDELLDELHGVIYFSKLDLRSGYHQIRMLPEDIYKTAFRTHSGHYEFIVMPFSLTNAPATFQAAMNDLFHPYLRKFMLENAFCVNLKKCFMGKSKVSFLGHQISAQGVEVETEKVEAVREWPIPNNVKELRGFLGLAGYYRLFVRDFGIIARPLTELTKKDAFLWSELTQKAFDNLKRALVRAPVLQLPNFGRTTISCTLNFPPFNLRTS